ncbi:SIS domain-containing protein [Bacillus mangrovi]|uniref:SIS domain-containing protein n=1 Tax=Metabacillus mangrovi TaxID=1491830 RepID=A0A7X2S121_9BACI|nr:SIS domain-containing protein [Metabacillus mangrovi]
MTKGGLSIITSTMNRLPESERKIAQYILDYPHEAVNSTVQEISKSSNTSGAAVVRLCKSLGLKGFQDLKLRIAGDLLKPAAPGYRDIEPEEPLYTTAMKTASNSIQAITDTSELLDYQQLEQAVRLLLSAGNVHFFGVGASGIVAADAQQKLLRISKQATAFSDLHLVATLIANAKEDDLLFAVSHSGETPEILKILKLAKEKGVRTIGLTHFGQSKMTALCDVCLYTSSSGEAPFRSAATSSRLAQLYVIDVLFLGLAANQYSETVQQIDRTREAIRSITGREK